MTKALVVVVTALSFGCAGAAFAASAPSKSGGAQASSSKASSSSAAKTSGPSNPAASKAAAKGALNANGPSLDGFEGERIVFSKADRVVPQRGRN